MMTDDEIDNIFAICGYEKESRLQYKPNFSNDEIYHYVEMERSIRDRSHLGGRIRVGNKETAVLSAELLLKYENRLLDGVPERGFDAVNEIFANIDKESKYTLAGKLFTEYPSNISAFLNEVITPLFRPINNMQTLYHYTLFEEGTPLGWSRSGSDLRTTQALIIAKKLGISFSDVTAELAPKRKTIEEWSDIKDLDDFCSFVWERA